MIRRAPIDDSLQLVGLLTDCGLASDDLPGPERDAEFQVEDNDGVITGSIGMEFYGETGLLRSTAVAPSSRSGGLGGRLVTEALNTAIRHGCREVVLLTETAEKFFEKMGFVRVERTSVPADVQASSQFSAVRCADAAVMRLSLARGTGLAADQPPA